MTKTIGKKIAKLDKIPHPKGRKAAQLSKNVIKAAKREKVKLHYQMKTNLAGEKLLWFQENLEPVESYTPELLIQLIEKYLNRFDEELKQIQLKHATGGRKKRQHASREDIIKMTIKNERNEFESSGIEIPDILNPKQLNLLRNWSGELRFLQNFKLMRYSKSKLKNMKTGDKCLTKKTEDEEHSEKDLPETEESENGKEETNEEDESMDMT